MVLCKDELDKGTYNYAKNTSGMLDWTSDSDHGRLDMNPYFRQFGKNPWYRNILGHFYFKEDYNDLYILDSNNILNYNSAL